MGSKTERPTQKQSVTILFSLMLSILLVFAVVQALIAAGSDTAVNQDEIPTDGENDTITRTAAIENYIANHTLTDEQLAELTAQDIEYTLIQTAVADFSGSEKRVTQSSAQPGATLNYSIVISNSDSGLTGTPVIITDTLPAELSYVNGSINTAGDGVAANIITSTNGIVWEGTVDANGIATVSFSAMLTDTVSVDDIITNTAQLNDGTTVLELTAETTIVAESTMQFIYLPLMFRPLEAPELTSTRPNSANQWTLSWDDIGTDVTYQLQESHDPTFASSTTTYNVSGTSYDASHSFSTDNVYYYRVRGLINNVSGIWSNSQKVVGGYVDEFTSNQTGWDGPPQRTTFIEEVQSFYEIKNGDDWLILRVEDSRDWGIASPLQMAPEPPYVIEYRVRPANLGNLVSYGVAFGGDWDGRTCPDTSTVAGWYEHDICFNQFYNTNTIWFGGTEGLKLLFERVDRLVWCPECGGSPMKRLGDIEGNIKGLSNVDADGWNNYRIEVRESGIRFFANGSLQYTYGDTRYVGRPYFGVFASTDEYSNSTARFEYVRVLPLDN